HLLTCEPLSGEEAERIGLVSLCVEPDQVHERARAVAVRLASGSQRAVRGTKYGRNKWVRGGRPVFGASLGLEFLGPSGPDLAEGVAAIKGKRPASFSGPASE